MRTKLLGAFIAALAITAFAALPSMASAANVTLKEGSTTVAVGETLRAHSTNAVFKGRPSEREIKCARTSLRGQVRTNPGTRITFRSGGRFRNLADGDQCVVEGGGLPGGRLTARVENVTFRSDILLQKTGTHVEGEVEVRFTFRIFDRGRAGETPIAECNYDGVVEVRSTVGSHEFHATGRVPLESGSESCDTEGHFRGDFRLSRRDGTSPVKTN
jgi:hypothetical protein